MNSIWNDQNYSIVRGIGGFWQVHFKGELVKVTKSKPLATLIAIGHRNAQAGNLLHEVRQ